MIARWHRTHECRTTWQTRGWLTVLLVVLAVANLAIAGLILRGEARR